MAGPSPDRTPNTSRRVCKLKSRGSPKSPVFLRPFQHADAIVEQPESKFQVNLKKISIK